MTITKYAYDGQNVQVQFDCEEVNCLPEVVPTLLKLLERTEAEVAPWAPESLNLSQDIMPNPFDANEYAQNYARGMQFYLEAENKLKEALFRDALASWKDNYHREVSLGRKPEPPVIPLMSILDNDKAVEYYMGVFRSDPKFDGVNVRDYAVTEKPLAVSPGDLSPNSTSSEPALTPPKNPVGDEDGFGMGRYLAAIGTNVRELQSGQKYKAANGDEYEWRRIRNPFNAADGRWYLL